MKKLVCDSSALISLSENCMLPVVHELAGKVQIFVPKTVYKEVVSDPLNSKRYAFKAFLIDDYFSKSLIHTYQENVEQQSLEIMGMANSIFEFQNRPIKIIHNGEAQALACLQSLGEKTLLIDERTTRLLIEDPLKLHDYMEERMGKDIELDHTVLSKFQEKMKGIKIIRSAELAVFAYERGWINGKSTDKTLRDMLFALKFAGCSITEEEIQSYMDMLG